jgi:hypothetical protein
MIVNKYINGGGGSGSGSTGPQGPQGPQGYQGADGQNGADGINGQDGAQGPQGPAGEGGSGSESPIIAIDNLNGTGSANTIYDYNGRLYHWVSGAGVWGKWVIADFFEGQNNMNNQMTYLAYSYLPSSATLLCSLKFVTNARYYSLSYDSANEALLVYDSRNGTGNVVATIYKDGQETTLAYPSQNQKIYVKWEEGLITFKCDSFTGTDDRISTTVSEGHFEADDVADFKGGNLNGASGKGGLRLPAWNSEGLIYGAAMDVAVSSKRLNNTGYTNTISLLTKGLHQGYESWFIPTQGGTAGQVLTSAGNAEPQWETRIKAVKITSAAYQALQTKDPNTLYLIDDNV